jgi:hypothetical protein
MPVLTFVRPKRWWAALRAAHVLLDSSAVIRVRNGARVSIEAPSGPHEVSARIAGFSSKTQSFVLDRDMTITVLVPSNPAFTLIRRFLLRREIVTLQIDP